MNETKLIQSCLKKNKKAWRIFFKKYSRLIYWAINKHLKTINFNYQQSDIEDIFQEVFLTLYRDNKINQVKDAKYIAGWLAMLASNKTKDYMRKKISSREDLIVDNPKFSTYSFKESLLSQDDFSIISKIMKNLSRKERIIISLNYLEGKTHKQIAKIANIPQNTVSTIVLRTKEKIKNELKKMKEL